ncbi:MAG: EF-P beta-lysylation protein EpmB [Gammaproteobacteria bacterium]|nr:EF-P beta-lysylation protein EpmB [Gammaproteobacteria bacterium]
MIPRTGASWQQQLASAFNRVEELFDYLEIPQAQLPSACAASAGFPLRVPREFASRMEKGNPADPLLLQVLPRGEELIPHPRFTTDPLDEQQQSESSGLLQKYHGRMLFIATGTCAVHCRYCFRRHFPYTAAGTVRNQWTESMELLTRTPSIKEVILSGGDPLTLSDGRLSDLVRALDPISHVKRLRIHTRLPTLLPDRITGELIDLMNRGRMKPVLVLHINHPREISGNLPDALSALVNGGITLLNQSVLLRDVNNDPDTLCELSESMFSCGVLPYYLHMLDPVSGAQHFEVRENEAGKLIQDLRGRLPGYLVPRLARELPGADSKTILT